jgi:hypothetical protein
MFTSVTSKDDLDTSKLLSFFSLLETVSIQSTRSRGDPTVSRVIQ